MESSSSTGFDDLIRLFKPTPRTSSDAVATTKTAASEERLESNNIEVDGGDGGGNASAPVSIQRPLKNSIYENTFGRTQSNSSSLLSPSQRGYYSSSLKGKGRAGDDDDYFGTSRRSGESLSRWDEEGEERNEVYVTPLSPRLQDRERRLATQVDTGASSSAERIAKSNSGLGIIDSGGGGGGGGGGVENTSDSIRLGRKSSKRSRSIDEDMASPLFDSNKGYRRIEKALEAERQKQLQASADSLAPPPIASSLPRTFTPSPKPSLAGVDRTETTHTLDPLSIPSIPERGLTSDRVSIPRRSSSVSRSRNHSTEGGTAVSTVTSKRLSFLGPNESITESKKGNVTFRNRALSEPSSSHEVKNVRAGSSSKRRVSEETSRVISRQREQSEKAKMTDSNDQIILKPARTRPLSLPVVGFSGFPPNQAGNRTSLAPISPEMASSIIMPWDPAQSTAFSLQNATMEGGFGRFSDDQYRGLSSSTRPSLNLGLLLHNRAQARFHLRALNQLRARIPSNPTSTLSAICYHAWFPIVHHLFLFLITYAQVPATLFLDYNTLFVAIQVAVYPDEGGTSAAWWIAAGIYIAAILVWFVGIVIIWEVLIEFKRRWSNSRPFALPIYLSATAFNLTAIKSIALYSLLFRARLSADRRDFWIESFWFYSQNWPTVLTLLPRGIILTILIVLYNPVTGTRSTPSTPQVRDTVYFDQDTGLMTNFSFIILLFNAAWMAWRIFLLVLAYTGLLVTLGVKSWYGRERASYDWHDSDSILGEYPPHTSTNRAGLAKHQQFSTATGFEQPLLNNSGENQSFAPQSSFAQDMVRDEDLRASGHKPAETSQLQHPSQSIPHARTSAPTLHLPSWAWRGRAEERLNTLIIQCVGIDTRHINTSSTTAWPQSPGAAEAQQSGRIPDSAPVINLEMLERTRADPDRIDSSTSALYPNLNDMDGGAIEMMSTPALAQGAEVEPRFSESSVATSYDGITSSTVLPAVIGRIDAGAVNGHKSTSNPSQNSSSSQLTTIPQRSGVGDRRGRWSSGSELSTQLDLGVNVMGRIRSDSGQANNSKATAGQGVAGLSVPDSIDQVISAGGRGIIGSDDDLAFPFPTASGEITPTTAGRARKRSTKDSSGAQSYKNNSPQMMQSSLETPVTNNRQKRRASSSLSSLTETLRFGRSSKSVDVAEGNDGGSGGVAGVNDMSSVKSDNTAWWSSLFKSRNGKAEDALHSGKLDKWGESEEPKMTLQEPGPSRIEGDIKEGVTPTRMNMTTMTRDEAIEEEQASQGTHETTSTEDSEEKRLWSQFPEQSRKYPPGMIALDLEQRHIAATANERQTIGEFRRKSNEDSRQSGITTLETSREEDEEEEEEGEEGRSGEGHGSDNERGAGEGLRPIKEESWSSSLDSASNSISNSNSNH